LIIVGIVVGLGLIVLIVWGIVKLIIWLVPKLLIGLLIILGIVAATVIVYLIVKAAPYIADFFEELFEGLADFFNWLAPKIAKFIKWLAPKILRGFLFILGIGSVAGLVVGIFYRDYLLSNYEILNNIIVLPLGSAVISLKIIDIMMIVFSSIVIVYLIVLSPKIAKAINYIMPKIAKFILWSAPKILVGVLFILGIGSVAGLFVGIFYRDYSLSNYEILNNIIELPLGSAVISLKMSDIMMMVFSSILIALILVCVINATKRKRTKFTCPYCYEEHGIADWGLKCTTKNCKSGVKKYNDTYGKDWIPLAQKKKCIKCKKAAQRFYCMNTVKEIPRVFFEKKSLPIALLGAKASGKSNYIGVLINEINKKMSSPFNCSLSMTCSQESKKAYDDLYYRPLYEAGYVVSATDAGVEVPPLIFPLKFMNAKNKIVNMAALTFYDTAGENLDDENVMYRINHYITNAHGIMLLLDPLQVPNIRNQLVQKGFKTLPPQNTDTSEILNRIIEVIRSVKKMKGQIQIPLALVFTKIDVLEQYDILPKDSCLREESEHIKRGAFIKPDFEHTNIQMQDLLDNWLGGELISYIKQFKDYSYFGVTSLGGNPNGTKIDSRGIHPRRVLDPLLWLLAAKSYIKTLKK